MFTFGKVMPTFVLSGLDDTAHSLLWLELWRIFCPCTNWAFRLFYLKELAKFCLKFLTGGSEVLLSLRSSSCFAKPSFLLRLMEVSAGARAGAIGGFLDRALVAKAASSILYFTSSSPWFESALLPLFRSSAAATSCFTFWLFWRIISFTRYDVLCEQFTKEMNVGTSFFNLVFVDLLCRSNDWSPERSAEP